MTEQARVDAFLAALREAARRYGVTLEAVAQTEQLGAVVQVRPVVRVQARDDWQGETDTPAPHVPPEAGSGRGSAARAGTGDTPAARAETGDGA